MKILLTGGLGQVGSYLAERFSESDEVTILDNFSNSLKDPESLNNVNIVKGDIRNKREVNELVDKVDAVIHTAAQISVKRSIEDPVFDAENNINGTLNLLEAARRADIRRFIYISSAAVYGKPECLPINEEHPTKPLSPYGLSKLTGERYTMLYHGLYGLPVVCLRPFNIFSPRQNPESPYSGVITKFIEKVRNNQNPVIFGDGNQTRDFVFIEDVVDAIFNTMENKKVVGKLFNIGTGTPTKIKELAETIIKVCDDKLELEFAPGLKGDIRDSYADITKAQKLLVYKPKYLLEQGLKLCMGR